jgi:hypothetical protein
MSRNVTLGVLIDDVRAEAGHSLQSNLGTAMREVLIKVLQRQQKRLWEDFDWPFMRIHRDVLTQNGQRFYNIPSDLTYESIERVEFKYGDRWIQLEYGIEQPDFDRFDSDRDIRSWPIYKWMEAEGGQIELWPIPSQNADASTKSGVVRITGKKNLRPLVAESDHADLDDTLLVLYSAAEVLAREKADDAKLKLQMAEKHYAKLRGRTSKSTTFSLSGAAPEHRDRMPKLIAVQGS